VEKHLTTGHKGGVGWKSVGRELQRSVEACLKKWNHSQREGGKGPYSPEEDAIIIERVKNMNWGLWSQLAVELGREASSVRKRWKLTLSKGGRIGSTP
jgi:hypothetical protein